MLTVGWHWKEKFFTCEGMLSIAVFPLSREPNVLGALDIGLAAPELDPDPVEIVTGAGTRRCHPSELSVT